LWHQRQISRVALAFRAAVRRPLRFIVCSDPGTLVGATFVSSGRIIVCAAILWGFSPDLAALAHLVLL
jgi:hypothetical protein